MRRSPGGYTIIEVMIFLAVSAVLMVSAMKLITGKQAQVDFTQKARDTQSQLQTWLSQVSAGFPGVDLTQDHCTAPANGRPIVQSGPPPTGSTYTPTCVYLGKAIQFPPDNGSSIYAYSVFGNMNFSGGLPSTLAESSPEPAIGQSAPSLTQGFDLTPLFIKKINTCKGVTTISCNSRLLGFYNSINSDSSTNNENELNAYLYNGYDGTPSAQDNSTVQQCLEMQSPCFSSPTPAYPDKLQYLRFCLSDGNRTAQLSITSSAGLGASVQLDFINC